MCQINYFGGGHLSGLGGQKSGKKRTFERQKSGHLSGGFLGHLNFYYFTIYIWYVTSSLHIITLTA